MRSKPTLYVIAVLALGAGVVLAVRHRKPAAPEEEGTAAGAPARKETTTPSGARMILLPGGSFLMGEKGGSEDVAFVRRVEVGPFWIDQYEVSQASFLELLKINPSKTDGLPEHPVERIAWFAAARYCNARSVKEGLTPCYDEKTWECDFQADGYRLPTEAEWEYACRAGTTTRYYFGDSPADLPAHAWFEANADKSHHQRGTRPPNPWGLYDMHGNVWEWCNDHYAADYYRQGPERDPRGPGPEAGEKRVLRGGSWLVEEDRCTSAARRSDVPAVDDVCSGREDHGFRCVRSARPEAR
jgi:formylglycine-generating enzyme required for sulfatase activity